uniref:Uncharacterized protein LOC111107065 n=1 Tax=Crassostrea virginica TaxID=6565 RepID=A0A8B8B2V6_CRAVI|nr:uncharacterized protein LOC111107065 [Crassostrea virginica]
MGCRGHSSPDLYAPLLILPVLWLVPGALNACPQSSPGICLLPVRRLQHFVSELPPLGGFYTAYNQSGLMEICKSVNEYENCSQTITNGCDINTIQNIRILHSVFMPVCGTFYQDYLKHRDCFNRQLFMYKSCHQRRQARVNHLKRENQYNLRICEVTNEYVKCVYLVTALQCSMEAANAYFNILNQSISLSFSDANFACSIRHPDDDISVFTTTKATTTKTTFSDYTTRGGRPKEKRSISSATDTPAATRWCFYVIAVLLLHVTSTF